MNLFRYTNVTNFFINLAKLKKFNQHKNQMIFGGVGGGGEYTINLT
jgi:hypothetical protein